LLVEELPDLIAMHYGPTYEKFEVKPGIQIGGGLSPGKISRGQQTRLTFILQNALDTKVEGEISLGVPSKKGLFKKTYLSTITPVSFTLNPTEVEMLQIPIGSDPQTPSDRYEVYIFIKGKGGKQGRRVRSSETESGWAKAIGKSVAVSAILLPLFGGISIYRPTREVKISFRVTEEVSKETQPMEVNRRKIWTETHSKCYSIVEKWIRNGIEKLQKDPEVLDNVSSRFQNRLFPLIIHSSQLEEESEEWFAWISSLFLNMLCEGIFTSLISTNITQKLVEKADDEMPDTSKLVFEQELVNSMSDGDILNQLVSIGAMATMDILFEGKKPDKTVAQTFWRLVYPSILASLSSTEAPDYVVFLAALIHVALKRVELLFPNKVERNRHLLSIERIISRRKEIGEKQKKYLLQEVSNAQQAQSRNSA